MQISEDQVEISDYSGMTFILFLYIICIAIFHVMFACASFQ